MSLFKTKPYNFNAEIIISISASIGINAITFLSMAVISRMMSVDDYGKIIMYEAWIKMFAIVCGLQTYSAIGTARVHYSENEFKNFIASALTVSIVSSIIFLVVGYIIITSGLFLHELSNNIIVILLLNSVAVYVVNFQSAAYIQQKKIVQNTLLSLAVTLSTALLSWFLINMFSKELYAGRILGLFIPYLFVSLWIVFKTMHGAAVWWNKAYFVYALSMGVPIVFHGLSTVFLAQTDKIMLQYLQDSYTEVGLYGLAVSFAHVLSIIYTAINRVWVPSYYDDMKAKNAGSILKRSQRYMTFATVLFAGFLFLMPEVFKLYAAEEYWDMIKVIPVIAGSSYLVLLYTFAVNYEFYKRKALLIAVGSCFAAVINIFLNYWLIPVWGISGAAIATFFSYLLLLIFHHIMAGIVSDHDYFYNLFFYIKFMSLMILIVLLTYLLMPWPFLRWITGVGMGCWWLKHIVTTKHLF